jgi:uncharacterized SAM-binding protein YcdF (DUF218 family)
MKHTNAICSPRLRITDAIARGVALFLGGFSLLNLLGSLRAPGFDATLWWIDLRIFPDWLAAMFLLPVSICLVAFAVRPPRSAWRRILTLSCLTILAALTVANAISYYVLLLRGDISTAVPVPLSLAFCAALVFILVGALRGIYAEYQTKDVFVLGGVCASCACIFPLAQMLCFGKTDYRRPADAVVVLGARAYADGRPSDALADRVRTACKLYRDGLAKKMIFSGGPGDGAIHETEAMRRMAVQLGVKPEDILRDEAGLNTRATVRNTEAIFSQLPARRVLVVSHFYHLPRIKLTYQRDGWDVYTVPAKETYLLRQTPYNMLREVAAFWVYYFRPLIS